MTTTTCESDKTEFRLDSPFLIIGCGSSGSHLLSILLDKHPLLACGPELGLFNKPSIYEGFATFQDNFERWLSSGASTGGWFNHQPFLENLHAYYTSQSEVVDLVAEVDSVREFIDRFFSRVLERRGKAIWGEQTLSNCYCVPSFLEMFPNASVIHLVRDGRDVMCSLMKRGFAPYSAAARWLYDVSVATSHRDRTNYMQLRYRDLVRAPERSLRRVCSHIGVDYSDAILSVDQENEYWANVSSRKVHQTWKHTPSAATISTASVDRYKRDLQIEHSQLFWSVMLTPWAIRKNNLAFRSNIELMSHLGFTDGVPDDIPKAPAGEVLRGLRMWLGRSRFEMQYEKRLWSPLTWTIPNLNLSSRR